MIRVTVRSNLNLTFSDFESQSSTLAELLNEIEEIHKMMEICPDCEVLLNGESYQSLHDRLNTRLRDGDKVEINMIMLGGG